MKAYKKPSVWQFEVHKSSIQNALRTESIQQKDERKFNGDGDEKQQRAEENICSEKKLDRMELKKITLNEWK